MMKLWNYGITEWWNDWMIKLWNDMMEWWNAGFQNDNILNDGMRNDVMTYWTNNWIMEWWSNGMIDLQNGRMEWWIDRMTYERIMDKLIEGMTEWFIEEIME